MFADRARKVMDGLRRGPVGAGPSSEVPCCEQLEQRVLLSLLGVGDELGYPQLDYDYNGSVAYDHVAQELTVDSMPMGLRLTADQTIPYRVFRPADFDIQIAVDNGGNLLGGIEAVDDLVITGNLDVNGDWVFDYTGTLLTGEIIAFGYLDTGTPTDQYDYRFEVTGGALAEFFDGYDIGIAMTSSNSTFSGVFTESFSGMSNGIVGPIGKLPEPPATVSGRVYYDSDNDGSDAGEDGIAGVTVELTGTDVDGNAVSVTAVTAADGSYLFEDVVAGTYTLTETQPDIYLDGTDSAGSTDGTAGPVGTDAITDVTLVAGQEAVGVNFGEIIGCDLFGFVWEDFNDDGEINFGEQVIEGVTVTVTGTDDLGDVLLTDVTLAQGDYYFTNLRPGTYTVTETQPEGFEDGQDSLGTVDGVVTGALANDQFSEITLAVGQDGENYNFGELPQAGSAIAAGQTATIGFWQNKNGQGLLEELPGSTQLGNWLSATFPNLFGAVSPQDLEGMTNAEVADYYSLVFKAKRSAKLTAKKLEVQIMATAFATYVTNSTLAGNTAESYGFMVTEHGLGIATINVGDNGAAFGVADGTEMTVMEILAATNDQSIDGVLFQMNNLWRSMANEVYTAINEGGDI